MIQSNIIDYQNKTCIIGSDMNTDLDKVNPVSTFINQFSANNNMHRCDSLFQSLSRRSTYSNDALHCESNIDFFLVNDTSCLLGFEVIDPAVNLSGRLPITFSCKCLCVNPSVHSRRNKYSADTMKVTQLRWDYADLALYYNTTGLCLQPLVNKL